MKTLCLDNLMSPEHCHEIPNYDSRIAILKFLDARETIGFAHMSLGFAGTTDYLDFDKNLVRAIHTRHAVIDLNNSFDLLLQIPWMFYRAWSAFNKDGILHAKNLCNSSQVVRNSDGWVNKAEKECNYSKVISYCKANSILIQKDFEDFHNEFLSNKNKAFTIRSLCNAMKHNHIIPFKELYEPYDCTVEINGYKIKPKKMDICCVTEQEFFDIEKPNEGIGKIITSMGSDLSIDIEYFGGEQFHFTDCSHNTYRVSISEVLSECLLYSDALVDLYERIYDSIYPKIIPCLTHKPPARCVKGDLIDLSKYFLPLND